MIIIIIILIVLIFITCVTFATIIASSKSGRRVSSTTEQTSEEVFEESTVSDDDFIQDNVPSKTTFAVYGVDKGKALSDVIIVASFDKVKILLILFQFHGYLCSNVRTKPFRT